MIKPIKSFGCSFIFGSDLDDCITANNQKSSQLTYPALIAKYLNLDYSCRAKGGVGNFNIHLQIMNALSFREHKEQSPWIINWTYIDRFDFESLTGEVHTVRPGSKDRYSEFYYKNMHTEHTDKLRSLTYIHSAIQALQHEKIPFIMTYMDDLLFDTQFNISGGIEFLQKQIQPYMTTFEGLDFLTWSKHKGFAMGDTGHPLKDAHAAAADFLLPAIESILHKA